jgi:hypothetical protein
MASVCQSIEVDTCTSMRSVQEQRNVTAGGREAKRLASALFAAKRRQLERTTANRF